MSKYLITGGAGFIGSHIVKHLVAHGEDVRVIDNFLTGSRDNLSEVIESIELIEGDIRDMETIRKAMKGVNYCLHQAAIPSVPRSIEDPLTSNEINISGTLNTLLAARDAGVERYVCASSSSVYGDSEVLPKQEDLPTRPLSPYAMTKLASEQYTRMFYSLYDLQTVCLRYFNVFGPRQNPDSAYAAVVPIFIKAMMSDRPAPVHGDGEQSRDFCYVDNVVASNILACSAAAEKAAGKVFNIACGERHTVNELVQELNELLDKRIEPVHISRRKGDVRDSLADITLARECLGYEPKIGFGEGLRHTITWFQERPPAKRS